jgi:glycosyltransferase involved in cell wall biosynthesis
MVGYVGTFDPRKGMRDFPGIVAGVCRAVPATRLRLIGTRGMLTTADEVLAEFPRAVRDRIEVIPTFDPAALPELLAGCSVGVFPSAVEAFGFGVLEMLAAAVPVIAYRAPGPPVMLPDEYLVGRGDIGGMVAKVVGLLKDPTRLRAARAWARGRAADFDWDDIAARTAAEYERRLARLRGAAP